MGTARVSTTRNTSAFLTMQGVANTYAHKIHEQGTPTVLDLITRREVDLIINVTDEYVAKEFDDDYTIRRAAVEWLSTIPLPRAVQWNWPHTSPPRQFRTQCKINEMWLRLNNPILK